MGKDRRQFKRLKVSAECTVHWQGQSARGYIENFSPKGALINRLRILPPVGALVALKFQVKENHVETVNTVDSVVVRSISETMNDQTVGALAVLFEDQSEEVRSKLNTALYTLASRKRTS
jgi:hypothetical protein